MILRRRAMLAPTMAILLLGSGFAATPAAAEGAEAVISATVQSSVQMALGASGSAATSLATSSLDGPMTALSDADRLSYTTAFDALRRGELEAARASARSAQDRILLGQVEFESLFHPSHTATFEELSAWLEQYADLPCAPRAYALAMRRRPDGAAEPRRPGGNAVSRTWASVQAAADAGGVEDAQGKAARIALNNDDLHGAYQLGEASGDWWTAGLAAWRLNDPARAFSAFERVAVDPTEDPWVRAGAGVWAAKSATASGRVDRAQEFLRLAAKWPATFYGQVALAQLGETPVIENAGPRPYDAGGFQQASLSSEPLGVDQRELNAFIRSDPSARLTLAFAEVGRDADARETLKTGLRTAGDNARRLWVGLARSLGGRIGLNRPSSVERIDAQNYPVPVLEPEGGFTIERALVYAIARKESGFNAEARSSVGAYGMMQVMPTTAAELAGDRGFVTDPQRLWQPATNLRLGQAYIRKMLDMSAFQGDVMRAVASYNAGPGPMLAAVRKLGPNADPLLLIETIDVPQARQYVEEVMAAYWIYQRMFGGQLNTLEAVAGGAALVPASLDVTPPQTPALPQPVRIAYAPSLGG